jgi:hypothetical protein
MIPILRFKASFSPMAPYAIAAEAYSALLGLLMNIALLPLMKSG